MRKIHSMLLIITTLACFECAQASMCVDGRPSVASEYASVYTVVTAKVVEVRHDPEAALADRGDLGRDVVDRVIVTVISTYKGTKRRSLIFENPRTSAAIPVKVGVRYLLFLYRTKAGVFFVDVCGSSNDLAHVNRETLEMVKRLATH